MENTENSDQTIDLVTGFGWLVVRHPNLMEPFTDNLYARYRHLNKLLIILN